MNVLKRTRGRPACRAMFEDQSLCGQSELVVDPAEVVRGPFEHGHRQTKWNSLDCSGTLHTRVAELPMVPAAVLR